MEFPQILDFMKKISKKKSCITRAIKKNIQYTLGGDSSFIMNAPVAITVDDRGILYVCDEADKSIYRFKLSNNLDEDIIIED